MSSFRCVDFGIFNVESDKEWVHSWKLIFKEINDSLENNCINKIVLIKIALKIEMENFP